MPAGLQCWDATGKLVVDAQTRTLRFDFEATAVVTFAGTANAVGSIANSTFATSNTIVTARQLRSGVWIPVCACVSDGAVIFVSRPYFQPYQLTITYQVFRY